MGTNKFDLKHMKKLEDQFKLTDEQKNGLDVMKEDVADLLNTFNWAMYEGDAMICSNDFHEKEDWINRFKTICEDLQVYYNIIYKDDGVYLDLLPEDS